MHQTAADAFGAGEGGHGHLVVGQQFLAHFGSGAGDGVVDAGRDARVLEHLAQQLRRHRGEHGRFGDHGIACGEGGADGAGEEVQREVPRGDGGDDAHGLIGDEVEHALAGDVDDLSLQRLGAVGVEAEGADGQGDVDGAGLADGLPGVQGLPLGEFVQAFLETVGDAVEVGGAFFRIQFGPVAGGEGGVGGVDGASGVVHRRQGQGGDDIARAGGRRDRKSVV